MAEQTTVADRLVAGLLDKIRQRGITSKAAGVLRSLVEDHDAVADLSKRRGRARGGGQSSKAKGRAAVQKVRQLLLDGSKIGYQPNLEDDDVLVKATSMGGNDLHLSPLAQATYPFGIEVKNVEALNIWGALAQATVNAKKTNLTPLVFFTRAHAPMYVALPADVFVNMRASRCCDNGLFGQEHDCQKSNKAVA